MADPPPSKKRKLTPHTLLLNSQYLHPTAEPFRIGTAKLPLDALTTVWRIGTNRPLENKQVQRLQRIYKQDGVAREVEEHHLVVACTRAEFERAVEDYCSKAQDDTPETLQPSIRSRSPQAFPGIKWPLLSSWLNVGNKPAELIAGQHRVKAFQEYLALQRLPALENESWWVCDFYDIG